MEGTNQMSPNADKQNSATEPTAGFNAGQVEGSVFCRIAAVSEMTNPFPWARASTASECSHWEEVQRMVQEFEDTKEVVIRGVSLSVAQVAAVAKKPNVTVSLDSGSSARKKVDESSDWVAENMKMAAGFGANSATAHSRTSQGAELQHELIRFLNAGVLVEDGVNTLPVATTRAAILVRINSLLQGYSGIRWEILEALAKLLNERITPKVPLRGGLENLVPLAYIAGLLIGRPNSRATTMSGEEVTGIKALQLVGITEPFELRPKEGIALVNGTAVGSGLASTVSYDANVLTLFTEIATALFCEVMHGKPEFTDHLTHKLKHHPGQIEAAAIMEWVLEGSSYMKATAKLRENDPLKKAKQDRYALRTAPQWLGPQIEVIRAATHAIEREINSVNDNPIIDVSRSKSLQGGSFLSSPIGVAMDNMRLALAALGKLMFAQMSELVSGIYSNGLPANLPGGPNPSLDYGLKGAEIAMASYCSELQYLANPVTTHVQSAEQHNQDVNSLGLISARKTAESIDVLRLMASTFLVTLCQAVDLRHLEENMQASLKEVVSMAAKKALLVDSEGQKLFSGFLKSNLSKVVDDQSPFACSDNPWNASNPLMRNLRHSLVAYAMDNTDGDEGRNLLKRIIIFEVEVRAQLEAAIPAFRERFDNGVTSLPNRIVDCRSFPLYSFVRSLGTKLLVGTNSRCPGQDIEKVYSAILKGELAAPLLKCLDGWSGTPTPVDCPQ